MIIYLWTRRVLMLRHTHTHTRKYISHMRLSLSLALRKLLVAGWDTKCQQHPRSTCKFQYLYDPTYMWRQHTHIHIQCGGGFVHFLYIYMLYTTRKCCSHKINKPKR